MSADLSGFSNRFVSENDIEEAKRKRQEDWERVRRPDQPTEAPEEEYDHRSLFERLEEQRVKKQEEWDESHRMKNMVRGLEDDEVEFLDFVAQRQEQLESQRKLEEDLLLAEYKSATLPALPTVTSLSSCKANPQKALPQQRKSQKALLAGAVKRKSTDCGKVEGPKQLKLGGCHDGLDGSALPTLSPSDAGENGTGATTVSQPAASAGNGSMAATTASTGTGATSSGAAVTAAGGPPAGGSRDTQGGGTAASIGTTRVLVNNCCSVVAILPGIGDYQDHSDDSVSTSTSSDDELDDLMYPTKPKVVVKRCGGAEGGDDNG